MTTRTAKIGDIGILAGQERHGSISGLLIQIDAETQAHLYGDWRMVNDLVETFEGGQVEVVEAEGSGYGAHGIRPLDRATFSAR